MRLKKLAEEMQSHFREHGIVANVSIYLHEVDNDLSREKAEEAASQVGEATHGLANDGSVAWAKAETERPGLTLTAFYPAREYIKREQKNNRLAGRST